MTGSAMPNSLSTSGLNTWRSAKCSLCAKEESPMFYTGCMIRDGFASDCGWQCDGNGNLTRPTLESEK